ncbi:MAG TPA: cation transporter [Marinilabiliaceae bacterium]|nr:cation transporter [Marinilabiliaceae bacterium]
MRHKHDEHLHQRLIGEQDKVGVKRRLQTAFALNFFFTIIEFIGGAITNSMAILSDAVHDLGDTVAIGSALWFEKIAERERNDRYTYGYRRFSTLGALITSTILVVGSVLILYESIPRLLKPEEVMARGMMWMAVLGIVFNGIAAVRLRGGGASLNNRAVMLHLLEDVLGWVAVLVGSVIIHYTQWYWIDPLLSIGVAVFILSSVIINLKSILRVFLQTSPVGFDKAAMEKEILALENVLALHDTHVWSLDGNFNILSIHLVVPENLSPAGQSEVRAKADKIIKSYEIDHPTIALEFEGDDCVQCD